MRILPRDCAERAPSSRVALLEAMEGTYKACSKPAHLSR